MSDFFCVTSRLLVLEDEDDDEYEDDILSAISGALTQEMVRLLKRALRGPFSGYVVPGFARLR
jgi:hypothetical protein